MLVAGEPGSEIHPDLAPVGRNIVVTKGRVSAFSGSDLELVLTANEIDTLALGGVATSGVVLSTVRAAADRDYSLTVLSDGCYDPDSTVHDVLMDQIFPAQADVTQVKDFLRKLDQGR